MEVVPKKKRHISRIRGGKGKKGRFAEKKKRGDMSVLKGCQAVKKNWTRNFPRGGLSGQIALGKQKRRGWSESNIEGGMADAFLEQ